MCVCQALGNQENAEMGYKNGISGRRLRVRRKGLTQAGLGLGEVLQDELGKGDAFLRTRQKGGQGLTEASFGTREIMQKYAKDHANEPGWWLVGRGPSW